MSNLCENTIQKNRENKMENCLMEGYHTWTITFVNNTWEKEVQLFKNDKDSWKSEEE